MAVRDALHAATTLATNLATQPLLFLRRHRRTISSTGGPTDGDAAIAGVLHMVKTLYDAAAKQGDGGPLYGELAELLVDGFDAEQIWEELQLKHQPLMKHLKAQILRLEEEPAVTEMNASGEEDTMDDEQEEEEEDKSEDEDEDESTNEEMELEMEEEEQEQEEEEEEEELEEELERQPPGLVDDDFFSLDEMNNFVDERERVEMGLDDKGKGDSRDDDDDEDDDAAGGDDEDIDYFQDIPSDDEDDEMDGDDGSDNDIGGKPATEYTYQDFFAPPKRKSAQRTGPKRVRDADEDSNDDDDHVDNGIDDEEMSDQDLDEEDDEADGGDQNTKRRRFLEDNDEDEDEDEEGLSKYERKLRTIRKTISKLEEENLQKRSWQLMGEASAKDRPVNSLLEEVLDFEQATKTAPLVTEEVTNTIEDMIKRRIADHAFDDVQRKLPDLANNATKGTQVELDHDKSKKSLSEIYEEAFLKQQEAANKPESGTQTTQEAHPTTKIPKTETDKAHARIRQQFSDLCARLDVLTNFHFTPEVPEEAEMQVIANVPAMVVEEKVPAAFSEANRLAPEEIYRKQRVVIAGQLELSAAEKKRHRLKSKQTQKKKAKDREAKDLKRLEKGKAGLGNKYSKQKLEGVVKGKNVQIIGETTAKPSRPTSGASFKL